MNSVFDLESMYLWLSQELASWPVINAYLFGSILNLENNRPGDVDLYVCYEIEKISEIVKLKASIQERFLIEFDVELHLLLLTGRESCEHEKFLEDALFRSRCIIGKQFLTRRCCRTNFPLRSKYAAERGIMA